MIIKMKTQKILFWSITGLLSLGMLMSGFMYLSKNPQIVTGFNLLGLPMYFVTLLGVAKLAGAIALLIPKFETMKEWAYAGFTFTFTGAVWIHIATGTPFAGPLIALILLAASYLLRKKLLTQTITPKV
jgi:uncharacterized membrane protein YphA (DoxX/SURF4 family)